MRLHRQDRAGAFDDVSFIHHSLPGVSAEQVDIGTTVLGCRWEAPFYIDAMTGGTQATAAINADLAEAAAEAGVAIACGSQHVALHDPERADGFHVIRRGPRAPSCWPTSGRPSARRRRAGRGDAGGRRPADPPQRGPGAGHARGRPRLHRLGARRSPPSSRPCPSRWWSRRWDSGSHAERIEALARTGVAAVDVAGAGGTDFIAIENERRPQRDLSYLVGWGQSTALCLLESAGGR